MIGLNPPTVPPPAPVVESVYALIQLISDQKKAKATLDALMAASEELEKTRAAHAAAVAEHERRKAEVEKAHGARDKELADREAAHLAKTAAAERELAVRTKDLDAREKILAANEDAHRQRLERINHAIRTS